MKSREQKAFLSAAILTSAIAVVILAATLIGFRNTWAMVIWDSMMMTVAMLLAAGVWIKR